MQMQVQFSFFFIIFCYYS